MKDQSRRTSQRVQEQPRPGQGQSLAPVGFDLVSGHAQVIPTPLATRQRRLRGLVAGIAAAMALLIVVGLSRSRVARAPSTANAAALPVALPNSAELVPVASLTELSPPPVVTRDLPAAQATLVPSLPSAQAVAAETASAPRPLPQKIAPSERKSAAPTSGVSRPQSSSVFDAPFVPPH